MCCVDVFVKVQKHGWNNSVVKLGSVVTANALNTPPRDYNRKIKT